ncbi:MAG TPA: alpha-amylase family glycosyl hydrolase [Candidatus Angelobacter sp.]|nr:alpha-amylase family glycosyl hydrolase [Candidatus Angelobacter sp.]
MTNAIKIGRYCTAFLLTLVLAATAQPTPGPRITKIEPPNWWIGLSNPMLMITGENLTHAKVSTTMPGIKVRRTMDGRNGHYLFVWLEISKNASPGRVNLTLATLHGRQTTSLFLDRRKDESQGFNGFNSDDVIYLIMTDRFADGDPSNNFPSSGTYDRNQPRAYHGGDLRGIQQHLPYLKDLGVTTLWITPIYNNDDHTGRDYHGYGAVDLYSVEEHFGTLDDYRSLVHTAHNLGLKVILDIVPNHIGPENPWAADPPTEHWLHGTRDNHLTSTADFAHIADPHSSSRDWRNIIEGWFVGILPDLGTGDPVTSLYLRQNAIWWAETGSLDGFRLDTFPYVDRKFWHDFHADLHRLHPRFRAVGEVSGFNPVVASYFVGGKTTAGIDTGVDTIFDFSLYHALREVILHNASFKLLAEVLQYDWLFPHPELLVTFLGNHDTPRFMGEANATPEKLSLAFALLLTMRGIPQIYAGDEIGMAGGEDPDNRRDFPGGFPGDQHNAFSAEGRTPDEQRIFAELRTLLHLRRQHPALRWGKQIHIFSDDQTYVFLRDFKGEDKQWTTTRSKKPTPTEHPEQLLIFLNNADHQRTVEIEISDTPLAQAQALSGIKAQNEATIIPGAKVKVTLPGRSLSIYRVEEY